MKKALVLLALTLLPFTAEAHRRPWIHRHHQWWCHQHHKYHQHSRNHHWNKHHYHPKRSIHINLGGPRVIHDTETIVIEKEVIYLDEASVHASCYYFTDGEYEGYQYGTDHGHHNHDHRHDNGLIHEHRFGQSDHTHDE